ncbi:site-specific integrase [Mesorhizobium sp. M1A.F.Ca.IN.020.30.1.1]|uniref:tyrosine-type recombinase/integrase n=1 Tax=unclassified Mesorhizobium TaxID=325217 RepID=UPI000FD61EEC|nr:MULTISPECIES: site-specific integrase [unclassified Mesorhizobium]RUV68246.1 site-specific integrase [Mesorhizobium sp. M1A.F.Ca.IN.020.30.1.1]RWG31474.1 MAG: site-specific integrase [Mesorhizobium sp.]RWG74776.1 MAG: site-specific integrase [Mesorhizobium sp.]TIM78443.1 MAG: site-specific integrase [Mesorhizobium sp.]TIM83675.1 MAG: site-specific integrase [Mesorhizobium sp.]
MRWSKFADGERMPFLVWAATSIPLQAPTYWVVSKRRPSGIQPNTLHNDLRALMYLYLWADARGVDLQDRLESGALLTLTEVVDLDTFCGRYLDEAVGELPGQDGHVIRLVVRKSNNKKKASRRTVNLIEKRNRLKAVYSFLEYASADHLSRLHLWPDRWSHYSSVRDNCLQWIRTRYEAIKKPSRNDLGAREGLEEAEVARLRAVIEPDHPENPFEPKVRFRNYLIIRLLLGVGVRRGELLGIRIEDCKLGSNGTVTVHRRPDDPDDPRKVQPSSKTEARVLPLNGRLTEILYEWIVHHRPKIAGARKHPFLIVDCDDGRPLSLSAVNKLMRRLRRRVPGLPEKLSAHVLRHSWNDAFSDAMDRKSVPGDQEAKWRARLMGWRREESAAAYLRRTVRRRSNEVLIEMQDGLDIQHADNGVLG